MDARAERIGWWISGGAHGVLILWAVLGGAFLRPQPSQPLRTTNVATMTGAEFEAMAAAARGAGPVSPDAAAVAELSLPSASDSAAVPDEVDTPVAPVPEAQALSQPDAPEGPPDLADFATAPPVELASDLPGAPDANQIQPEASPVTPADPTGPATGSQPARPAAPAGDTVTTAPAPSSALALARSAPPRPRPDGLEAASAARIAAAQAAASQRLEAERAAEAEVARQTAEAEARQQAEAEAVERAEAAAAQAQADEAEAVRAADARAEAAAEAEAARQTLERQAAEQANRRAAEQRRQDEERRAEEAAEETRQAEATAAEARAEAEARAAVAAQAAADAEAEAQAAAAEAAADADRQAEARQQALEDALREAQAGTSKGTATANQSDAGGDRQRIEGGSGASAAQDPLAAAMAAALSGLDDPVAADDAASPLGTLPPDGPAPLQLAPSDLRPLPSSAGEVGPPATATSATVPMGAPLSLTERDGLVFAIRDCWNVGALSIEAAQMSVSVGFTMTPDGLPEPASLHMAGYRGGSEVAARQAFDVARRAILMCGRSGFTLPAEKYGRWRDVVVDFRPEGIGF